MKILLITYNYLQFYNASSIQARRFFSELADRGCKITVITNQDDTNIKICHENIRIYTVYSFKKTLLYKISSILKLNELNFMPDWDFFMWNPFVLFKLHFLSKENFDFVHTISSPASTHLIPVLWRHKRTVKWIAQFYDPWTDNTYINLRFLFFKNLNLTLEQIVARNADLIIHTNKYVAKHWDTRYSDNLTKAKLVLPLCIEVSPANLELEQYTDPSDKIIISHVGSIYGKRNLNSFLRALTTLFDQSKTLTEKLTVNLIGKLPPAEMDKINKISFASIFNFIGEVSYSESIKYMQESSLLLLIEEESSESLFFPSKLTDYLSVWKPILGILPGNCVARDILEENNHACFQHSEVHAIANYIKNFRTNVTFNKKINRGISKLHTDVVASSYLMAINQLS